jgi:hypothetical protein
MIWTMLKELVFRCSRWLSRQTEKYASPLFLAIASVIVCLNVLLLYRPSDPFAAVGAVIFFFMLMFGGGVFIAWGTPIVVRGHLWLRRRFEESAEITRDSPMLSQFLVSVLLNIIVMCVIVGLVPPSIVSPTMYELAKIVSQPQTAWRWYFIWWLIFPGTAGPLILHWIRTSRRKARNSSVGARWLAVLQALCYVSWFLLFLWWVLPSDVTVQLGVWGIRENFWPFFFTAALPSTLISLVVIHEIGETKSSEPCLRIPSDTSSVIAFGPSQEGRKSREATEEDGPARLGIKGQPKKQLLSDLDFTGRCSNRSCGLATGTRTASGEFLGLGNLITSARNVEMATESAKIKLAGPVGREPT